MPLALIRYALAAIFLIAFSPLSGWAQALLPVPALTAHVLDQTNTLDAAQTGSLEARLTELEKREGTQLVVLMVDSTAPEDIASFANRVGNTWKIGRPDVGDGLIIVVAKRDRKMRIEVAKALEGAIPDLAAARIIDQAMKPKFRDNDFAGGLNAAIDQLAARIAGEPLPEPAPGGSAPAAQSSWLDIGGIVLFAVLGASQIVSALFGKRLGALLLGAGTGLAIFVFGASLLVSLLTAIGAALFVLLVTGASRSPWVGGGGGSHWGGGGSSSGGGFSSGGGGDFGGGGASGDW